MNIESKAKALKKLWLKEKLNGVVEREFQKAAVTELNRIISGDLKGTAANKTYDTVYKMYLDTV